MCGWGISRCSKSYDEEGSGMVATFVVVFGLFSFAGAVSPPYNVGVGRYDITGPAADVNMVNSQYTLVHTRHDTQASGDGV